jgi:hypothetical protein
MPTTYIVELSSGDILETQDGNEYVAWLDEHGPEVVSSHECPDGDRALADAIIADKSLVDAIVLAKIRG